MNIYGGDSETIFIRGAYNAKLLLEDSFSRTQTGINLLKNNDYLAGCGHVLLARIESAAANALVAFNSSVLILGSILISPFFLVPAIVLNGASRIPGISSYETVRNFTLYSSDAISRCFKISLILPPVVLIFLTVSCINTFLPSVLKTENIFTNAITALTESLGPLKTFHVNVPGSEDVFGSLSELNFLEGLEEYSRSLSFKNHYKEITVSHVIYHYKSKIVKA